MDKKEELRRKMLNLRLMLSEEEVENKSKAICNKIEKLEIVKNANSIMGYYPIRKEVNILPFLEKMKAEKIVLLPYSKKKSKEIIPVIFEVEFIKDEIGIPAPKNAKVYDKEIDIILVPGLAFDISLYRLGYGYGFYDKFLRKKRNSFKIGVAYDFQVVEAIPIDGEDIKMDMIVTEKRIIS